MKFLRNLFVPEIAQLTREALLYKRLYEAECEKNAVLEKAVITERRAKDKFVNTFCDQISKQNGLPMVFKEKVEQPKPEPEPLSLAEEESIKYIAQQLQDDDRAMAEQGENMPVYQLEDYIAAIRQDPSKYLQNGR